VPVLALAAVVIAVDQGAKQWALSRLSGDRSISVAGGWMHLHLLVNAGAAFSFASGSTWVFTVAASVAVLAIPWYAARTHGWSLGLGITLGLLLGGAAGNLADRLFRAPGPGTGRVVDFIDYHGWFTGNIADIAIVVSAALLIARATFTSRRDSRDRRQQAATDG
jgi:signal peptidase II